MAPRLPFPRRRNAVAKAGATPNYLANAATGAGLQTPAAIDQAMAAQGMDATARLGPGRPVNPSWGYSTQPRVTDYPVGVNIQTGDSRVSWGRTSFGTLRAVIDAYDVSRMCISHKIDELRSMEPLFLPADGVSGDVQAAIDVARLALEFPDGDPDHPFDTWLGMWLEDCLRYDAGSLYRRRNRAGDVIGLEVLDGTTLAPKIDEHGRKPRPPAPAWQQIIKGLPTVDFTTDDIVRTTFRPQPNSPFGLAPIESVLLTVNTDLRHQQHFLELFTEGTVPAGFVELPGDLSTPDQVAEWQDYWDALMAGDQAMLRRLRAVPAGTKVSETRPKTFDVEFAKYLMIRTCGAFGVVPQDLGLIDDVNRATGETQTDIQFRVNTLPWVRFVEGMLTRYLRRDLGLPVQVKLDTGRDVVDRAAEAQAWDTAVKGGAVSVDEWRQEVYGLPIDNERPTPRFIYSPRTGPVPLRSLYAIAGPIDPETAAPADELPLDTTAYDGSKGVLPDKLPGVPEFARAVTDPDDPRRPETEHEVPGSDVAGLAAPAGAAVAKDAPATAGVTSVTGIAGNPMADAKLVSTVSGVDDDDEDEDEDGEEVAKAAELAAFRRFAKARAKAGRWRDFTFTAVAALDAHRLNQHGRARVRKDAGQIVAAGLAVVAADTGRVLMLQRALEPGDPNGGLWEFPGGCLEDGETPDEGAAREWAEETGLTLPSGRWADVSWTSPNGVYQGFVYITAEESALPIFDRQPGTNPDDPDGDAVEALAWWDPQMLGGNPVIRPELGLSFEQVLDAISGAVDAGPKAVAKSWRDGPDTHPLHAYDLKVTDHYTPIIEAALRSLFTSEQLRAAAAAVAGQVAKAADDGARRQTIAAQVADLLGPQADPAQLEAAVRQVIADGYLVGGHVAAEQLGPTAVTLPGGTGTAVASADWAAWQPGDVGAAIAAADGGLADLLAHAGVAVKGIVGTALDQLGNRIADGLLDGLDVDTVAASLSDWATGARAEMIAHTEMARSATAASLETYAVNGIRQWDLVTSAGACTVCRDVAAANPHTGDGDAAPLHPRCRCSVSPHVDPSWFGAGSVTDNNAE